MDSSQSPLTTPDDAEDISGDMGDDRQNDAVLNSSLSPPSPSLPMRILPVMPPDMTHLLAARTLTILRTLALRNFEIGRKYAYRAAPHVGSWLQKMAANLGTSGRSLYFRLRQAMRKLAPWLDHSLLRLQIALERSDTAVIWFTLLLIFGCILLTLLLWNLI